MVTHWVAITCLLISINIIGCEPEVQHRSYDADEQTYSKSNYDSPVTQPPYTGEEKEQKFWKQDLQPPYSEGAARNHGVSSVNRPRQRVVGCSGDGCSSPLFSGPAAASSSSSSSSSSSGGGGNNYYWQKPGHPCSTHQGTDCPYGFKCVNYLSCSNGVISESGNWGYASQKPSIEELMNYGRPCGYSGTEVCCQDVPPRAQQTEVEQPSYYSSSSSEKPIEGPIYYPPAPAFPTQRPDSTTETPVYNPPSYKPYQQTYPEDYPQPPYKLPPPGYAPVYITTTAKPAYKPPPVYTTTKPAYRPPPPVYTPAPPVYNPPPPVYTPKPPVYNPPPPVYNPAPPAYKPPVYTPVYTTSKPPYYRPSPPSYTPVYARPKPAYKPQQQTHTAAAYGPPAYPGCAAALKCVPEEFCSIEGIIISKPIYLSNEQKQYRTPLMTCLDVETNQNGFCCRDPRYSGSNYH